MSRSGEGSGSPRPVDTWRSSKGFFTLGWAVRFYSCVDTTHPRIARRSCVPASRTWVTTRS